MPVTTTFIDNTIPPGDPSGSIGFQGDFTFDSAVVTFLTASTFDERVVTFQSKPVRKAGLTAGNWDVSGNVVAGPARALGVKSKFLDISVVMN